MNPWSSKLLLLFFTVVVFVAGGVVVMGGVVAVGVLVVGVLVVGVLVGGSLVVVNSKPWTTTLNLTVTVSTMLLTEQMYSPSSAGVTESMVRTLLSEREGLANGSIQVYEAGGFATAEHFSRRRFPSVTVIGSGCEDSTSWGP